MMAYVESLREKTALPDLTTIMDSRTAPAVVGPRTTVRDAAKLMKENRTTAVCVMENLGSQSGPPRIAGIFTSKDVVLRVIAAGLEPGRCSVVRVMTPHPDVAPPTMTIQDALKKMHSKPLRSTTHASFLTRVQTAITSISLLLNLTEDLSPSLTSSN